MNIARLLLLYMLVAFCTPFTLFDEASIYIADTESELVHYYLTPLPDNGEACADDYPKFNPPLNIIYISPQEFSNPARPQPIIFYHPPEILHSGFYIQSPF